MTETDIQKTIPELGADNALNVSLKLNDLIRLIEAAKRDAWCIRTPNTEYAAGNQVNIPGVENYGFMMKCTTAGMTGATPLDFSDIYAGKQITDGTAIWEVVERVSFPDIPDAPVVTVNGKAGDVTISIDDITGLRAAVDAIGQKLPLAGGTMTGTITKAAGNTVLAKNDNNKGLTYVYGGTHYTDGSFLLLTGGDNDEKGNFYLVSVDVETGVRHVLKGTKDGVISWDGKPIALEGVCLLAAGGAMTHPFSIRRDVDSSSLGLYGGSSLTGGAQLVLCGADYEFADDLKGSFRLQARNSTANHILQGNTDGTLTLDGKDITLGYPNYAAGVALAGLENHTIQENGFLRCQVYSGGNGAAKLYVTINSIDIELWADDYSTDSCLLPVKKGDEIYVKSNNATTGTFVVFYPLR